jgi:hypothetical protein
MLSSRGAKKVPQLLNIWHMYKQLKIHQTPWKWKGDTRTSKWAHSS